MNVLKKILNLFNYNSETPINTIKIDIDYNELAKSLIKTQEEISNIKQQEKESDLQKWKDSLNIKDYPNNPIKQFLNDVQYVWKIIMHPKEYHANRISGTKLFMNMFLTGFFKILEVLFYIGCIVEYTLLITSILKHELIWIILCGFALIGTFFFARFFNITVLEIDEINDENKLTTLFSAVATFIAMVFTIVSVVISLLT